MTCLCISYTNRAKHILKLICIICIYLDNKTPRVTVVIQGDGSTFEAINDSLERELPVIIMEVCT